MSNLSRVGGIVLLVVMCTLLPAGRLWARDEGLTLTLESNQREYALREPVKFVASLRNDTDRPVAVVEFDYLDSNMEFMELEVTGPDGESEMRSTRHDYYLEGSMPHWRGEPLMPGEKVDVALTPNASFIVGGNIRDWSVTFPRSGEYTVRVHYVVSEYYQNLWKGPGGRLVSNPVAVRFREPTDEEREILDAYWAKDGYWISFGEQGKDCRFDIDALRRTLAKYENHEMSRYLRFALARQLLREYAKAPAREAAELLEKLRRDHPTFREEEVSMNLADAYKLSGNREKSVALLERMLKTGPALQRNVRFMTQFLTTKFPEGNPTTEWRSQRKKKRDMVFPN